MQGTENFHIGAGQVLIDGRDVGLTTEEGVVVNYEPDVHLHLSGKYGTTPVKASLVGQKLTIEIWIAENTMENIRDAYAGVILSSGKISFGGLAGREVVGKSLTLIPQDGTAVWYFRSAVPTEAIDTNYKVNDERIIHVTFTALVDMTATDADNIGYLSS